MSLLLRITKNNELITNNTKRITNTKNNELITNNNELITKKYY